MIRKNCYLVIFFFAFTLAQAAFAASFTATVNRTTVPAGESFTLELSLSGAAAKKAPDLSPLDRDFSVYGTGQSTQTTIINGKVSSSRHWQVTLIPAKEGRLTIPAITIDTDEGELTSKPVSINVVKSSAAAQGSENSAILVYTEISKNTPFVNEPVMLTAKMVARRSVANITLPDVTADNVIIEQQGDPDIYDGVLQGQRVKIVEVRYLVTPLEAGTVNIPRLVFQGKVDTGRQKNPFSGRFSDPFGMFEDFGFASYTPFAVAGEDIVLDVKPPAVSVDPWLPAYMVKLSDHWEGADRAKVGEPITRKLTLIAEGQISAALPGLERQVNPNGDFKVYSDKPVTVDRPGENGESIGGWREESYTLIPEKPGTFTLPEIKVPWWDILDSKLVYATVPAKTIVVAGAPASASTLREPDPASLGSRAAQLAEEEGGAGNNNGTSDVIPPYIYGIIAGLAVLVVIMAAVLAYLFYRLARQYHAHGKAPVKQQQAANEDRISLAAIKKISSPDDLRAFLQAYAHQHWGLPKNAALQVIGAALRARNPGADLSVFAALDAALYAGADFDLDAAKSVLHDTLDTARAQPVRKKQGRKLGALNPS